MGHIEGGGVRAVRDGLALGMDGLGLGLACAALSGRMAFIAAGRALRGTFRHIKRQTSGAVAGAAGRFRRGGCLLKRCGC